MVILLIIQETQLSQNNGTYINMLVLFINSYSYERMSQLQEKIIPDIIPTRNVK